jgi:hypothetical protein
LTKVSKKKRGHGLGPQKENVVDRLDLNVQNVVNAVNVQNVVNAVIVEIVVIAVIVEIVSIAVIGVIGVTVATELTKDIVNEKGRTENGTKTRDTIAKADVTGTTGTEGTAKIVTRTNEDADAAGRAQMTGKTTNRERESCA